MRQEDGSYKVTRRMSLGVELVGRGATKEEARADLKTEVQKYQAMKAGRGLMIAAGEISSPGFVAGERSYTFDANRMAQVLKVNASAFKK